MGLVFLAGPLAYMILALVVGMLSDKFVSSLWLFSGMQTLDNNDPHPMLRVPDTWLSRDL